MKDVIKQFASRTHCLCAIICIALIGFSMAACDALGLGGGGSGNGGTGGGANINIVGDWEGTMGGYPIIATLSSNRWTVDIPGWGYETGTYTRNGNNLTLYVFHYDYGTDVEVGSAVLLSNDSMRFTINAGTKFDGTYLVYRVQ